jgi:hypothetical protein
MMTTADLAQDARITAANLLAIINGGHQNTAYAVDKMRGAADLLVRLAAHIAPPDVADRDDETFGKPSTIAAVLRHDSAFSVADEARIVDSTLARWAHDPPETDLSAPTIATATTEHETQADAERVAAAAVDEAIARRDTRTCGTAAQVALDAFEPGRWIFISCDFDTHGNTAATVRRR